jgi:hypothetical protein
VGRETRGTTSMLPADIPRRGKSKSRKQIATTNDSYTVKDDIEIGTQQTIPLWLFGFLY